MREPGPRSGRSRRGLVLALASGAALVLGAAWLLRERAESPLAPTLAGQTARADGDAPVLLVDPRSDAPDASATPETRTEQAPAVVDLSVRLVERTAQHARPGELRSTLRGVPGVRATWAEVHAATSDPDGVLRFEAVPEGRGELRVEAHGGLLPWQATLDLRRSSGGLRRTGDALTYEVELHRDLGRLGGQVVDADGAAVADAWVALTRGSGAQRRTPGEDDLLAPPVRSAADGRFELPLVNDAERLEILVVPVGAGLPVGHVRTLDGNEAAGGRDVTVALPAARRVHVRVLEADGRPARGRVCVQRDGALWPADCEPRLAHTGVATARGTFQRAPGELQAELADGAWVVHFVPDAHERSRALFQFTLAAQGETRFEFRLPPAPARD